MWSKRTNGLHAVIPGYAHSGVAVIAAALRKEAPVMTGSALALIVIPIVTTVALAMWLFIVFYADAHPQWKARRASYGAGDPGTAIGADASQQNALAKTPLAVAGGGVEPGGSEDGGRAAPPSRRAA
jgi:hypothetical protein